ncbi:MAG: hypothetical protein JSR66_16865 [Proteobacteria bacterium]|nr:hypothetical protein [Pseudomonadota bacterium]
MKMSVRGWLTLTGQLAVLCLSSGVEAKTIDVSSSEAGIFAEHRHYLIDRADPYMDLARAHARAPGAFTDLYRKGRRLAFDELRAPDSVARRADQFAIDLVKQDDFRVMLVVGAILVAQQLRRKHKSLKQSLISG